MGAFPILDAIFPIVGKVLDRVIPDTAAAEKAKSEMQAALIQAQVQGQLAQIDVNKAEAANANVFVSGWRPFIGWVCGTALTYQFVAAPVATWIATWAGYTVPPPPMLDNMLWELIFGMLGMGTLRTFEKVKGVASK